MLKMQEIAFPGFKFQTFSEGVCPQTPLGIHAWYVGHMAIPHQYIISQKGPFSKNATPPPPPQTRLGPYAHVVPCLPHLETLAFIEETKFASRKAKIIEYFLPNSQTFDETLSPFADTSKTI
jgi:hypothetical protein